MITKKSLFKEDSIELFCPDGIDFLHDILYSIGHNEFNKNISSAEKAKKEGIFVIEVLCDLDLIEIYKWGKVNPKISKTDFKKEELIDFLRNQWIITPDTPDFYHILIFKYKDWYLNALKNRGLTSTTYWKNFKKEEIGDLEEWIEENRP